MDVSLSHSTLSLKIHLKSLKKKRSLYILVL